MTEQQQQKTITRQGSRVTHKKKPTTVADKPKSRVKTKEERVKKEEHFIGIRLTHGHQICPLPFSLDTYRSCSHNCLYCFSFDKVQLNPSFYRYDRSDFSGVEMEAISDKSLDLKAFKDLMYHGTGRYSFYKGLVKARVPFRWGNNSDAFSSIETYQKKSLEMLRVFKELNYPVHIFTKSKWLVDQEEYMDLIQSQPNATVGISLISADDSLNAIDRGTDVQKRLDLLEALHDSNRTLVRIAPLIPEYCERHVDELMHELKKRNVQAVTAGSMFLPFHYNNLIIDHIRQLEALTDAKIMQFFANNSVRVFPRGRLLTYDVARQLKIPIKRSCDKYDIKFHNCGGGAMDLAYNWSCCDTPIEYTPNHSMGRVVILARDAPDHLVYYNDFFGTMNEQALALKTVNTKDCMNCGADEYYYRRTGQTYFDTIRSTWDNPRSPYNPAFEFDSIVLAGKDKDGHLFHRYIGDEQKGTCDQD